MRCQGGPDRCLIELTVRGGARAGVGSSEVRTNERTNERVGLAGLGHGVSLGGRGVGGWIGMGGSGGWMDGRG